jgi:hypothetical protein
MYKDEKEDKKDNQMSEATFKKKTQYNYHNNSVNRGPKGFSLNGTHRSQGWVGQDLRGRTLVRTLNRGGANRGHGGCCGTYPQPFVIPSEICSTEDPYVVKPSVINTDGMIRERFAWIWRPVPYTNVKPDDYHGVGDQRSYIEYLKQLTIYLNSQVCPCDFYCSKSILGAMNENEYLLEYKSECSVEDAFNNFCISRISCEQCPL